MYQKLNENKVLVTYKENEGATEFQEVEQIIKIEKRHFNKGEFYMETLDFNNFILEKIAKKEYNITEAKVILALKARLEFNNRIKTFRQTELAEESQTSQGRVSEALKKLEDDKIIIKNGNDWYFNDKYIKGSGNNKKKRK